MKLKEYLQQISNESTPKGLLARTYLSEKKKPRGAVTKKRFVEYVSTQSGSTTVAGIASLASEVYDGFVVQKTSVSPSVAI